MSRRGVRRTAWAALDVALRGLAWVPLAPALGLRWLADACAARAAAEPSPLALADLPPAARAWEQDQRGRPEPRHRHAGITEGEI